MRWLRPEFQAPKEAAAAKRGKQIEADLIVEQMKSKKPTLPKALPDQIAAVRAILAESDKAISAADLAKEFRQSKNTKARVEDLLQTLAMLGQADEVDGRYVLNG